jgi:opine dehydrogenase
MKVAVLGSGAIAFATAAVLLERDHDPILWSPSGRRTVNLAAGEPLRASGAITCTRPVRTAGSAREAVTGADAVLVAIAAVGHKPVLEAAASHLVDGQTVITR